MRERPRREKTPRGATRLMHSVRGSLKLRRIIGRAAALAIRFLPDIRARSAIALADKPLVAPFTDAQSNREIRARPSPHAVWRGPSTRGNAGGLAAPHVLLLGVLLLVVPATALPAPPLGNAAPASDDARRLQACHSGITDPQVGPEDRRRWADLLISAKMPEANAVIEELLLPTQRAEVQRAICSAIIQHTREYETPPDADLLHPLIALLFAESAEVRAAAAQALGEFTAPEATGQLADVAEDRSLPRSARLAAIDALASNAQQRDVTAALVGMLQAADPDELAHLTAALTPVASSSFGRDVAAWQAWWEKKKAQSAAEWLSEQLTRSRLRARRSTAEAAALQTEQDRELAAVAIRLREFQREALRSLPLEQRDAKLTEWIDDPVGAVQAAALGIIKARISDEGRRPDGEMLTRIMRMLDHSSPPLRREALSILQTLNNPAVVGAILERRRLEDDLPTRQAIFQALGRLGSASAVPALVEEIADDTSDAAGVREAATALAAIASGLPTREPLNLAIGPLSRRWQSTPTTDTGLRASLLSAMAGVADNGFREAFLQAVESDDPAVAQASIRGLLTLKDTSKLPRIAILASHVDPRVRLAAIETIGGLGRSDADLELLVNHLHRATEPNELVSHAAWRGFRSLLANRAIPDRVRESSRLDGMPDLQAKYLEELSNVMLTTGDFHTPDLERVEERLAGLLLEAGRAPEAAPHLRELYEIRFARGDATADEVGLRWLEAVLAGPTEQGIGDVVARVAEGASSDETRDRVATVIRRSADSPSGAADPSRNLRLLAELQRVRPNVVGSGWSKLLHELAERNQPQSEGVPGP